MGTLQIQRQFLRGGLGRPYGAIEAQWRPRKASEPRRFSTKSYQCCTGEQRARIYLLGYLTGLLKSEIASLTPSSSQLDDQTATLTLEARNSKHRKRDEIPSRYSGRNAEGVAGRFGS